MSAIITSLPNTITNGSLIDAGPVQANFAAILSQVNANGVDNVSAQTVGGLKTFSAQPQIPTANLGDASANAANTAFVAAALAALIPSGTVTDFAGTSAPTGWLECGGAAVSRTTYAALFSAIGTTWGAGDGSTTFNLPNLNGRMTIGRNGSISGITATTVGATQGAAAVTIAIANMPTHNHTIIDPGHIHTITDLGHAHTYNTLNYSGNYAQGGSRDSISSLAAVTTTSTTGIQINNANTGINITQNTGSGTALNVMNPVAAVIKIIKT